METDPQLTPHEASAEAVHAAKNAAQAVEIAREAQLNAAIEIAATKAAKLAIENAADIRHREANRAQEVILKADLVAQALVKSNAANDEKITKALSTALKEVFDTNVDSSRFIDVSRIPLICHSILDIRARLESLEGNLIWGVRIVIGAVLAALLGMVLIK